MLRIPLVAAMLAISLAPPPAIGQSPKLDEHEQYQAGLRAMEDQLPDLAIQRFEQSRAAFADNEEAARILDLKIAEASVRAARIESDPDAARARAEAALQKLTPQLLKNTDQAQFWAAQASLLLGRFQEAAEFFAGLADAKDAGLRNRSQLARAHLLAALNQTAEAYAMLETLAKSTDPQFKTEARLLHASLLLAAGDFETAATLLPAESKSVVPEGSPHQASRERYLRARLVLGQRKSADAVILFRELIKDPERLSTSIYHGSMVGLAEALQAGEQTAEAIEILINLVERHPRTPLLEGALARLLEWSRANESLKTRLEGRLVAWAAAPTLTEFEAALQAEEPKAPAGPKSVIPPKAAERAGYAIYYYSLFLGDKNTALSNKLAGLLLDRLQSELPDHPVTPASLLETARLQSAADRPEEAIATLTRLSASSPSASLQEEAANLVALLRFKEGKFEEAAAAFARVRSSLDPAIGDLATLNTGISLLRAGDETAFGSLFDSLQPSQSRIDLQLEQALTQAALARGDARPALDDFLRAHPTHPRIAEARLALAEEYLRIASNDPAAQQSARTQLGAIDPAGFTTYRPALRHLLVHLKLAELTGDWEPAIVHVTRFLSTRGTGDLNSALRLKLAEAYHMNGNHDRAWRMFASLAEEEEGLIREIALFFAARAALKTGTKKSPEEAIDHLRKVVDAKGELAEPAALLLARSLINEARPTEALAVLESISPDPPEKAEKIDALILAAEGHLALRQESNYRDAIMIYDRVLARQDLPYRLSNRFHSLKGRAYELLDEPGNALESYYRVINRENLAQDQEPTEWYWYTRCAFDAVRLLEQEKRWRSALNILRKLSQSDSPSAAEAANRADDLQLEHQIWDAQ